MGSKRIRAEEIAANIGVNVKTVYRMLAAGTIPHVRAGKLYIVSRAAFERWWDTCGVIRGQEVVQ